MTPAAAIRITLAGEAALDDFVEVLEAAAVWLWDRDIPQWEPGSMRAQRATFLRWARAGGLVVARAGSELAGGCFLVAEAPGAWQGREAPALYLRKLAVTRAHAGGELSRRIVAWCAESARERGLPRLRLDCWDGSAALRGFYREAGFRELDAVPSHGYAVRLFERELEQEPRPEVRRAGAADAESLRALVAAFREHLAASAPSDREIAERLPGALSDPGLEFACAWLGERAVGYTQTRFFDSLWVAGGEAVLEDLFVLEGFRRREIGRLLLRHALRRARERGAARLGLTTNERNLAAQSLYRSEGLVAQGEKRWGDGREIRWVRSLEDL